MSDARRTPTMEMRAHNNIFHSGVEMDSQQQQFCLKWNSFGTNLATSFSNLFKSETLADVILFCDGVSFKAHKLILAACSKHLSDLFEAAASAGPAAGASHSLLVILDGTSATNMAALLEFMYKGEVHVAQDALSSFLKAAECLQVKGLSIEHEKLAVAQGNVMETSAHLGGDSPPSRKRVKLTKEELEATVNHGGGRQSARQSPSPNYSPTMSPMYPPQHVPPAHYARQPQQQQMPPTSGAQPPLSPYDRLVYENNSRKRPLRSPNELLQESVRASVLRDGSKATSGSSPPPAFGSADRPPEVTSMGCNDTGEDIRRDPSCPEDLRIKVEPTSAGGAGSNGRNGSPPAQQDEPPSSTYGGSPPGGVDGGTAITHPFDDTGPADQQHITIPWNPTTGKLGHGKTGSTVTTPDGKKLKCPFCERLYGYETNLRAHIRQRHQGIRVPCPYCTRTFTRNNTVRRHIAREHRTELSLAQQAQARQLAAGVTHNQ